MPIAKTGGARICFATFRGSCYPRTGGAAARWRNLLIPRSGICYGGDPEYGPLGVDDACDMLVGAAISLGCRCRVLGIQPRHSSGKGIGGQCTSLCRAMLWVCIVVMGLVEYVFVEASFDAQIRLADLRTNGRPPQSTSHEELPPHARDSGPITADFGPKLSNMCFSQ